jgi:two-component system, response regulator YesN
VLIVEDDPDIRDSMVALIEAEAPWVQVGAAGDGLEAIELIEEGPEPCLTFLDIMMPVMNGLQFLDAVRERCLAPAMRVVLVSADMQLSSHVQYPGVAGRLPKPFRAAELLDVLRLHCPQRPGGAPPCA